MKSIFNAISYIGGIFSFFVVISGIVIFFIVKHDLKKENKNALYDWKDFE